MWAVRLGLTGPEKAVRPYKKSVRHRYCGEMPKLEPFHNTPFKFKISDSKNNSKDKECPKLLELYYLETNVVCRR